MGNRNPYEVLGVSPAATDEEIRYSASAMTQQKKKSKKHIGH